MAHENEPASNPQPQATTLSEAEQLRAQLVAYLVREGAIRSTRLEQAFASIPREIFLPPEVPLTKVYTDDAIVVKWDENRAPTSSSTQPFLMADMIETLQLEPAQNVLEIGSGVGYNAAILCFLLGDGAHLTSIELDPAMAQVAHQNLHRLAERQPEPGYERITIVTKDGSLGYTPHAPYDRIIVTVQQWEISPHWIDQLKVGGLLLLPLTVSQHLWGGVIPAFQKEANGLLRAVGVSHGSFMPMRGELAHPSTQPSVMTLPIDPVQFWPDLEGPARLALAAGSSRNGFCQFLQEPGSRQSEPTGDIFLELSGTLDPDLTPARSNYLSYQTFQGFVLALSAGRSDRLYTLMLGRPLAPEDSGDGLLVDGWRYRARGLILAEQAGPQTFDLILLLSATQPSPRVRLMSGWRLTGAENQTGRNGTTNLAVDIVLADWQKWQEIGQPGFFDWLLLAYPVTEPAPLPGYTISRRFYNLLLPYTAQRLPQN